MIAQDESKRRLRVAMAAFAAESMPAGYGVIGVRLHQSLAYAGAHILSGQEFGWDCIVAISLPAAWPFEDGRQRADMCFHTMFEVQPLPPDWVPVLNRCGLVWVPAQWNADLFREAGVTAPIMVSGYGIAPTVYYPAAARPDGPWTLLAWGAALVGRKNILTAIRAFVAAGLPPDEARLVVKLNAGMSESFVQDEHGQPYPNIEVIAQDWRYASQLGELCRSADCGIYTSAGEGWGLMVAEQMASGLPVICHNVTGMADFATDDLVLAVRSKGKERAPEYEKRFGGVFWQAVPDFDQTVAHIRWAFHHREDAAALGQRAAQAMHEHWTWAQAGTRALKLLEAHYGH